MNVNIIKTYTDFDGNEIINPAEGQVAYSPETKCCFKYVNGEWEKISIGINMNLYEMNKQIISQLPKISKENLEKGKELITEFAIEKSNKYYMLLCRDISYYTLFYTNSQKLLSPKFSEEVVECLKNIGNLISISLTEDKNAIEIWVDIAKLEETEGNGALGEIVKATVMYLFPYDAGVIECRK